MNFDKIFLKTKWHNILGVVLQGWLIPTGIDVNIELPLSIDSMKTDIVLLRNHPDYKRWTERQRSRLPDGIRDSAASHILIEFKKTESISAEAFLQALMYDTLYRKNQGLRYKQLQTFLVTSKTPHAKTLKIWDFVSTDIPGIYRSYNVALQRITLMDLNQLADTPHNIPYKCFASRQKEYEKAFYQLDQSKHEWPRAMILILNGLRRLLSIRWRKEDMLNLRTEELHQEGLIEEGKRWIKHLPPEDRLDGLSPQSRLKGLSLDEIELAVTNHLSEMPVETILKHFDPEEIERYLKSVRGQ